MKGSMVFDNLTLYPTCEGDKQLITTLVDWLSQGGAIDITVGNRTRRFWWELPKPKIVACEEDGESTEETDHAELLKQ